MISTAFAVKLSNQPLPWENGILDGSFELKMNQVVNEVSDRKLEGSFVNNKKAGVWKPYNKKNQLIQKRVYKNNFEYTLVEKDKESTSDFKLKKMENSMPMSLNGALIKKPGFPLHFKKNIS